MSFELFRQDPSAYAMLFIISLVITVLAYALIPLAIALTRRKSITKKKYRGLCYGINIAVFIIFIVINTEDGGVVNAAPYFLWTTLFSTLGIKILNSKGVILNEDDLECDVDTNENDEKDGAVMSLSPENEKTYDNGVALNDMHFKANSEPCIVDKSDETIPQPNIVDNNAKKGTNKKFVVIFLSILVVLALIVLVLVFLIIPTVKYNNAKSLLENGNYESAYSEFEKLDGYSDSEDMMLECRYLQAIKYRDAGDYEVANTIFESLGNYRDSKILIHNHDYRVVSRIEPTCTVAGSETLECSGCNKSKTNSLAASHKYVDVEIVQATCDSPGYKNLECLICHDTRFKFTNPKSHDYYAATCTKPRTCAQCGHEDGEALGHTDEIKCSRCGEITFKTLTYTGVGSKVIDYSLPNGKFKVVVTMTSGSNSVDAKMYYNVSYGDDYDYEWFYITSKGNSEMKYITGPTSGSIVVNAPSSYSGSSGWKIEISLVSN